MNLFCRQIKLSTQQASRGGCIARADGGSHAAVYCPGLSPFTRARATRGWPEVSSVFVTQQGVLTSHLVQSWSGGGGGDGGDDGKVIMAVMVKVNITTVMMTVIVMILVMVVVMVVVVVVVVVVK